MESEFIVSIYEGRLLRRSRLINRLQRVSFEDEYNLVVGSLNLHERSVVVDVACGTGIYARSIAREFPSGIVVGLDISIPMLTHAIDLKQREQLSNLHYVRADSQAIPLPGRYVDAAVCCGALHLFRDPEAVLGEFARVLKPGGRLAIATFRRRAGAFSAKAAALRHRLTGMAAYLPDELESILRRSGFSDIESHHAKGIWMIASAARST
jgi:ubiquinone/menaquinone biosynthesis C-methylase UbiE